MSIGSANLRVQQTQQLPAASVASPAARSSPRTQGACGAPPKESSIQLSKSHHPSPVMEFADIEGNYADLCDDKTKISPT